MLNAGSLPPSLIEIFQQPGRHFPRDPHLQEATADCTVVSIVVRTNLKAWKLDGTLHSGGENSWKDLRKQASVGICLCDQQICLCDRARRWRQRPAAEKVVVMKDYGRGALPVSRYSKNRMIVKGSGCAGTSNMKGIVEATYDLYGYKRIESARKAKLQGTEVLDLQA